MICDCINCIKVWYVNPYIYINNICENNIYLQIIWNLIKIYVARWRRNYFQQSGSLTLLVILCKPFAFINGIYNILNGWQNLILSKLLFVSSIIMCITPCWYGANKWRHARKDHTEMSSELRQTVTDYIRH